MAKKRRLKRPAKKSKAKTKAGKKIFASGYAFHGAGGGIFVGKKKAARKRSRGRYAFFHGAGGGH
jgi:hypothetical protein